MDKQQDSLPSSRIALLIDSDNTQLSKLETVINRISIRGRVIVKRAYGNWKKGTLKNWEEKLKLLAIKAEQQFDYTQGKNATDMALVIDAMELLHSERYDTFAIVSSDSDFTPLAIKLQESGAVVLGVGERKTPEAFRNACDEFIFLENLDEDSEERQEAEEKQAKVQKPAKEKQDAQAQAGAPKNPVGRKIHNLLKMAADNYQDENGFVNVANVGSYIRRAKPDFEPRAYGFSKLTDLIRAFPDKYEVRKTESTITYRCR